MNNEKTIRASMQVIKNLPLEAVANQEKSRDKTVPKESLLNRCLNHIGRIQGQIPLEERETSPILEEAWKVYMDLQNFQPLVGESQHWRPGTREFSLDSMHSDPPEVSIEDGVYVEASSPELHSGGLGFKHVNWDSNYLMAQPVKGNKNGYWNPKEAKKRKPVKHYTRDEIDKVFRSCG